MTTVTIERPIRTIHPWAVFAVRRLGRFLISLAVLVTASFAMIHLIPGDPVSAALGTSASPELIAGRRAALGLDQPILVQYADFIRNLFAGTLGESIITRQPVTQIIYARLPSTAALAGIAFILTLLVAIPLGLVIAVATRDGRRRPLETTFSGASGLLGALPEFLLAVGLVFIFAVQMKIFGVAGKSDARSFVLPVMALAAGPIAIMARLIKVDATKTLREEYIRTATSKRLPGRIIYLRHALPNVVTSTLTIGGLLLSGMLAGTVLIENVFAWPGLGTTIVQSITQKDYSVVQGVVLVYGIIALLINLTVDVILAVLDPRSTIREN